MVNEPPVSSPQNAVINVIVEILKADQTLKDKFNAFYRIPRLRDRLLDVPSLHIYHARRDQGPPAKVVGGPAGTNKSAYRNSAIVIVDVITTMDDTETKNRSIHNYENIIINLISDNVQIPNHRQLIPEGMVWQSIRYLGSDYEQDQLDEWTIDEALMQFEVLYDRRR